MHNPDPIPGSPLDIALDRLIDDALSQLAAEQESAELAEEKN